MTFKSAFKMIKNKCHVGWNTLWEKEKLHVKSNFSFFHNVFHSYISLVHQNAALCGNRLKEPEGCLGNIKSSTRDLDLDLGSTWTNVSNGTSSHDGEQLCKSILKSIQNYMGRTNIWPLSVTLTLGLPERIFQLALSTRDGEQLCRFIF